MNVTIERYQSYTDNNVVRTYFKFWKRCGRFDKCVLTTPPDQSLVVQAMLTDNIPVDEILDCITAFEKL